MGAPSNLMLLATAFSAAATRPVRVRSPALAPVSPAPSRRVALHALGLGLSAALPLGLAPRHACAVCRCETLDNCVCDDTISSDAALGVKKRYDAAGRDLATSKGEIAEMRALFNEDAAPRGRGGRGSPPPPPTAPTRDSLGRSKGGELSSRAQSGAFVADFGDDGVSTLGLSGGGTQEMGDMDPAVARERFRLIVAKQAVKMQSELGFELGPEDVRDIEARLRARYCGPTGIIGPC